MQLLLLTVMLSHQAVEFRQLWGSRSELRRFQDGGITEAVLWDGKSMIQRRMVPKQIIAHLLQLYVLTQLVKFKTHIHTGNL